MLSIKVPSRLHITLIDLGVSGYRRNGGIGFCIDDPTAELNFNPSPTIDLSLLLENGFNIDEVKLLTNRLAKIREDKGGTGIRLTNIRLAERHIGLGVGTITALSCVEALHIVNNRFVAKDELIRQSGRGGTSGIGIHGYFSGGFIFDVGRKFDNAPFKSSDDIERPTAIPLVVSNIPMPNWPVGIFYPPKAKPVSASIEQNLFASALPITANEVFETTYHAVFGVVAAIADNDFISFCSAINSIQNCAWKSAEIALHETTITDYPKSLKQLGCDAVGMSSVGPALYFFSKNFSDTASRIKALYPNATLITSFPNNKGREIINA